MKRFTFLILLGLFVGFGASACQNANSENNESKNSAVSEPGSSNDAAKPIVLSTQEFKDKVWNYEESPQEWVYNGDLPAVVDFYADWCGPCKRIAPIMEKIAEDYKGKVVIYKVNTDHNKELSSVFGIRSIPSVLFIPADGQPSMQAGAMQDEQYRKIIEEFVLGNEATK